MNIKKKVDKKSSVLDNSEVKKNINEPVAKNGFKEILGQVLQFVTVGGDFV